MIPTPAVTPAFEDLSDRDKGVVIRVLHAIEVTGNEQGHGGGVLPGFFDHPELVALRPAHAIAYCRAVRAAGTVDVAGGVVGPEYRPLIDLARRHAAAQIAIATRPWPRGDRELGDSEIEGIAAEYELPPVPAQGRFNDGGVLIYPCRGCGLATIYRGLCSDCQVDVELGLEAGSTYRSEQAREADEAGPA